MEETSVTTKPLVVLKDGHSFTGREQNNNNNNNRKRKKKEKEKKPHNNTKKGSNFSAQLPNQECRNL